MCRGFQDNRSHSNFTSIFQCLPLEWSGRKHNWATYTLYDVDINYVELVDFEELVTQVEIIVGHTFQVTSFPYIYGPGGMLFKLTSFP